MHVLFVNELADFVGGAERYVADTATMLRARGHRVSLFYGVSHWMEPRFTSLFDEALPIVALGRQVRELAPDIVYVHQLADQRLIREIDSAPVVRFFHDHALFCLRDHKYTAIGHETCRRPVGTHCYPCLGFVQKVGDKKLRLRTLSSLYAEQDANRGLSGYVVGSKYMREHVGLHDFPPDRVHVIPPFVFEPKAREDVVERDPHRLLFVGALIRGKGIDVLLRAMTHVPRPTRLRIIGSGKQENELRAEVASLGLADRVHFVGNVRHDDLDLEYRRAACVIVPSRAPETFGLTGPEAFLRGTPVIAADVGGMGEWLEHGVTGLSFRSGDPMALAEAIRTALGDPADALAMAERGRALTLDRFHADKHVNTLLALFETLTTPRDTKRPRAAQPTIE